MGSVKPLVSGDTHPVSVLEYEPPSSTSAFHSAVYMLKRGPSIPMKYPAYERRQNHKTCGNGESLNYLAIIFSPKAFYCLRNRQCNTESIVFLSSAQDNGRSCNIYKPQHRQNKEGRQRRAESRIFLADGGALPAPPRPLHRKVTPRPAVWLATPAPHPRPWPHWMRQVSCFCRFGVTTIFRAEHPEGSHFILRYMRVINGTSHSESLGDAEVISHKLCAGAIRSLRHAIGIWGCGPEQGREHRARNGPGGRSGNLMPHGPAHDLWLNRTLNTTARNSCASRTAMSATTHARPRSRHDLIRGEVRSTASFP